jgi:hypothetical protein
MTKEEQDAWKEFQGVRFGNTEYLRSGQVKAALNMTEENSTVFVKQLSYSMNSTSCQLHFYQQQTFFGCSQNVNDSLIVKYLRII